MANARGDRGGIKKVLIVLRVSLMYNLSLRDKYKIEYWKYDKGAKKKPYCLVSCNLMKSSRWDLRSRDVFTVFWYGPKLSTRIIHIHSCTHCFSLHLASPVYGSMESMNVDLGGQYRGINGKFKWEEINKMGFNWKGGGRASWVGA